MPYFVVLQLGVRISDDHSPWYGSVYKAIEHDYTV